MDDQHEWTLPETRDWVVQMCWQEHKNNPAGFGRMVGQNEIDPQGPPWKIFLEACQYLEGKYWITCEYGTAMGGQPYPHYVNNLKFTTTAIAAIQDSIEQQAENAEDDSPPVIGFIVD